MAILSRFEFKHLVLIGACSLALCVSSALSYAHSNMSPAQLATANSAQHNALAPANGFASQSKHQQQQYSSTNTPRDLLTRHSNIAPMASSSDLVGFNSIASSTMTGKGSTMGLINQPSVYHSIIDRTDGPSRRQASSAIQTSAATTDGDLHTAAGHHHGHAHGKYYEYRSVPKKKTWKFGYKRGNHKHTISRHEHGKAGKHPHFKTKVKWHDKKSKGKGIHLWDYNHHDKKHYHHG